MAVFSRFQRPKSLDYQVLTSEISRALSIPAHQISLLNVTEFTNGHRFLYFKTKHGFGKLAAEEIAKQQLIKEEANTVWAEQIGLRTVKILEPYKETSLGKGILLLEKLSVRPGTFINDFPILSKCSRKSSRQYARLAVGSILSSSYLPVSSIQPQHCPNQEIAQSPELMQSRTNSWAELFLQPKLKRGLVKAIPELSPSISAIVSAFFELETLIPRLVELWGKSDLPYFVHNDAYIKNMYFYKGWKGFNDAILTDFEHSTTTFYPVLGLLKDLADLYGGTAYNPYMQQEMLTVVFAHTFSHLPYAAGSEEIRLLLKAVVILGSLTFSQYAMQRALISSKHIAKTLQDDPIFQLVKQLLSHLPDHISYIDSLISHEEAMLIDLSTRYFGNEAANHSL